MPGWLGWFSSRASWWVPGLLLWSGLAALSGEVLPAISRSVLRALGGAGGHGGSRSDPGAGDLLTSLRPVLTLEPRSIPREASDARIRVIAVPGLSAGMLALASPTYAHVAGIDPAAAARGAATIALRSTRWPGRASSSLL